MTNSNKKRKSSYFFFSAAFVAIVILMFISHLRSDIEYKLDGPADGVVNLYTVGNHLVAISGTNEIYLWNWNNLEQLPKKISANAEKLLCLDDKRIIWIPSDSPGTTVISNLTADKIHKRLSLGYNKQCKYMEISGNGRFVVFGMTDKTGIDIDSDYPKQIQLRMLDVNSYELSYITGIDLEDKTLFIRNIAVSDDGRFIGLVGKKNDSGWMAVADAKLKKLLWEKMLPEPTRFASVVFSPDCKVIYAGGNDKILYRIQTASGKILDRLLTAKNAKSRGETVAVQHVTVSPNGRLVAAKSGSVHVWDCRSGKKIFSKRTIHKVPSSLAFSPDSRFLATSDLRAGGRIGIWRMPEH